MPALGLSALRLLICPILSLTAPHRPLCLLASLPHTPPLPSFSPPSCLGLPAALPSPSPWPAALPYPLTLACLPPSPASPAGLRALLSRFLGRKEPDHPGK